MKAAVFLDRDGTIIEDVGIVREPHQLIFLPRAIDALRLLGRHFHLFIVTNQSGIANGAVSHGQVLNVHWHLLKELNRQDVHIERVFCCPHAREDNCECMKPKPYFLEVAARDHAIDMAASFAVGDHPHDVDFATGVGAHGIYVLTGHGQKHRAQLPPGSTVADDLWEAATIILERSGQALEPQDTAPDAPTTKSPTSAREPRTGPPRHWTGSSRR